VLSDGELLATLFKKVCTDGGRLCTLFFKLLPDGELLATLFKKVCTDGGCLCTLFFKLLPDGEHLATLFKKVFADGYHQFRSESKKSQRIATLLVSSLH